MIVYRQRGWRRWHVPDHSGLWAGEPHVFTLCGKRLPVSLDMLCNGSKAVADYLCATCATKAAGR